MSRPYLEINSLSYATVSNVLSVGVHALRIRGGADITLSGLVTATISLSDGYTNGTYTYSVDIDGSTSSTATHVPATVTFALTGTAYPGDNFQMEVFGTPLDYTFSATSSSSVAATTLASQFDGLLMMIEGPLSASSSDSSLVLSAPYGSYYNGLDVNVESTLLVATYSEFSGGESLYELSVNSPSYFGFSESRSFNLITGETYNVGVD